MTIDSLTSAEKRAKVAENLPEVFGSINLIEIRQSVSEIVKLVGRGGLFDEYSLHDMNHVDALLQLVEKLIPSATAMALSTADWLLIVLSCYFHDLGMVVTESEYNDRGKSREFQLFCKEVFAGDKGKDYRSAVDLLTGDKKDKFLYEEFVRHHHADRINNWIRGEDAARFGNASAAVSVINGLLNKMDKVVKDDLAKICLSHHRSDLYDFDRYKTRRVYGDTEEGVANLHYAAIILRAADVLQIQKKRVPTVLYKLIDPSNPKSQDEWAKQAGVRSVTPQPASKNGESSTFEIHASFDRESAYFGLMAYVEQYAAVELKRCYDWTVLAKAHGSLFEFPWNRIDTSQVEPHGFEGRPFTFSLDKEKILKLLTGHTLYNDSRVAIREVLQNALDAVRFRKHLNPSEPLGKIQILWNAKTRKLSVRDTGTGMTQSTIENFLLNVGSSYYNSEEVSQKHSGFSSISRFGIGVLSAFMIADEVQVLTVHPEDAFARQLTLPSVVRSYLIKKLSKSDPLVERIGDHGTEVTLTVRRSADLKDVEKLIRYWMVVPGCEVTFSEGLDDVSIGYKNAEEVLAHYFKASRIRRRWSGGKIEFRSKSEAGIDLAYAVRKSDYLDVWDFECVGGSLFREVATQAESLDTSPGMCIEGIRVTSAPPGYENREGAPWAVVNLSGLHAPKTNVARSDIEQSPALDQALLKIYKLLGTHAETEFRRIRDLGQGFAKAAREADYILSDGLLRATARSHRLLEKSNSELRIVAMETNDICKAVSRREIEELPYVWTVDSDLIANIERICGNLGLDETSDGVISKLGGSVRNPIPKPRVLGNSLQPLAELEVDTISVFKDETASRIDLRWSKALEKRWTVIPTRLMRQESVRELRDIRIAFGESSSGICPDYDVIKWRSTYFIIATPAIRTLFNVFGMSVKFVKYLLMMTNTIQIDADERPLLRNQLADAGVNDPDLLISQLVLPTNRRYGERHSRHPVTED